MSRKDARYSYEVVARRPWEQPASSAASTSRGTPAILQGRDAKVMGIIGVACLLYGVSLCAGLVVGVVAGWTRQELTWFVSGLGLVVCGPAIGLSYWEIYRSSVIVRIVTPAEPQEIHIMRFVETRKAYRVPNCDLIQFVERIAVTGKAGRIAWRGTSMKSGVKCNDDYHAKMIEALLEAKIVEAGTGTAGVRLALDVEVAVARLGGMSASPP